MTRFARARGSKASNEKIPGDATPWSIMSGNARSALNNTEALNGDFNLNENFVIEDALNIDVECENESVGRNSINAEENKRSVKHAKAKNKKRTKRGENQSNENLCGNGSISVNDIPSKKMKHNNEGVNEISDDVLSNDGDEGDLSAGKSIEERLKLLSQKKIKERNGFGNQLPKSTVNLVTSEHGILATKKTNESKIVWSKTERGGMLGGLKVNKFQGYVVLEEDFQRLKKLEKDLRNSKCSKKDIYHQTLMERRKAEKKLARMRSKTCFRCGIPGHMLSACPQFNVNETNEDFDQLGKCFKCGSDDHMSRDCPNGGNATGDFKFATCFFCNEKGHIARHCKRNLNGLYKNGGGCRFCGNPTHFKKECPVRSDMAKNRLTSKEKNEEMDTGAQGCLLRDPNFAQNYTSLKKSSPKNQRDVRNPICKSENKTAGITIKKKETKTVLF